nr:reverse transcriptase domain-containing protein [Tanacetum cinerariifolium]
TLCFTGSLSWPFLLHKKHGIPLFLGPGSSGGGTRLLPTDFRFGRSRDPLRTIGGKKLYRCYNVLNLGTRDKDFDVLAIEITQEVLNVTAGGIFLYKTPNQAYQLLEDKVILKLDWAKNKKTKSSLKKTVAFADEGSSNSDTDKIMARMDAMTLKMDAQYKELQSNAKKTKPDLNEDDIPMSREEEAKFM